MGALRAGRWLLPLALAACSATAATLPPGFTQQTITQDLASPTALAVTPDSRLLVATQTGEVRIVEAGVLVAAPALSLAVDSSGERGLIGIALDPNFATNGYVYLQHTVPANGADAAFNQVTRFTMTGNVIDAGSAVVIHQLDPLALTHHNGGSLAFGPDGQLYVASGDNGVGALAQDLTSQLGKLLRLNPSGGASSGNPFSNTQGAAPEVWAYGLRNPFKIAFSSDDGSLFINDVGEETWEEINLGAAGANYGWPSEEGVGGNPLFTDPLFAYSHSGGCAITGGAFYASANQAFGASYGGDYFFADLCSGTIRVRDAVTGDVTTFAGDLGFGLVDLAVGTEGELYYATVGGALRMISGPFQNVPEPSSSMLVGFGLVAICASRRRLRDLPGVRRPASAPAARSRAGTSARRRP